MSQENPEPISIVLVEDHVSFRQALAYVFDSKPGFVVSGQAATLSEARGMLDEGDAAIIDLTLPDGSGKDLIRELRVKNPEMTILVLSATLEQQNLCEVIEAGASGVLDKLSGVREICEAIPRLRAGEVVLSYDEVEEVLKAASQRAADRSPHPDPLTRGDKDMLRALADGLDDANIAARFRVPVEKARSQLAAILTKLGARSRLHALLIAARRGLVSFTNPPGRLPQPDTNGENTLFE